MYLLNVAEIALSLLLLTPALIFKLQTTISKMCYMTLKGYKFDFQCNLKPSFSLLLFELKDSQQQYLIYEKESIPHSYSRYFIIFSESKFWAGT
jgi:hypothetical protein